MNTWYDQAIIYQIYPKSFQDSDGDGIGDLNGIRQRIPYLQDLGINAVWLNPVFVSPQVDNGYDVANYYAIDERMGTMADMQALIHELHEAGIRIILDFVLNHTSDQHPWFQDASRNVKSIYRDYYIFLDIIIKDQIIGEAFSAARFGRLIQPVPVNPISIYLISTCRI
ncbi:oligo-1,6-glucosidase [Lacticaseibacillus paracasei]|nr:oligo-1,6-glucosidase [Lacticaseibacillus paracasei]